MALFDTVQPITYVDPNYTVPYTSVVKALVRPNKGDLYCDKNIKIKRTYYLCI